MSCYVGCHAHSGGAHPEEGSLSASSALSRRDGLTGVLSAVLAEVEAMPLPLSPQGCTSALEPQPLPLPPAQAQGGPGTRRLA